MPKIKFTAHAIKRAKERDLVPYLNKERFWYDGEALDSTRSLVDNVVYCFQEKIKQIKGSDIGYLKEFKITTLYLYKGI